MHKMIFAAFLFLMAGFLHAQQGTAPNGYYPTGYFGDTWSGEVSGTNDASREITLVYNSSKKTETFVGVLRQGYTIKLQDGRSVELKPSMVHTGSRLRVYYIEKTRKVNGQKEKFNEIIQIDFLSN
jgi:hypothetical protein